MATQSFNTLNFQNKLNELVSMSESERFQAAESIRSDFRAWITNNFSLTDSQQEKFNNMPEELTNEAGYQIAHGVENQSNFTAWIGDGSLPPDRARVQIGIEIKWTFGEGVEIDINIGRG